MKKHNKEYVIKVGEELFRTQGYHNTGTEDILKKSNYPRSSFYYHFKSKEGFAAKVLESYGDNAESFYSQVLMDDSEKSPLKRIKTLFSMLSHAVTKSEFSSQCLVQKMSNECAGNNLFLRDIAKNEGIKFLVPLEKCVQMAQEKKEVRKDIDAIKIAQYLQAQIYGGFTIARLHSDVKIMDNGIKIALDHISS